VRRIGYLIAHLSQMLDEVLEPVLVAGDVAATQEANKKKSSLTLSSRQIKFKKSCIQRPRIAGRRVHAAEHLDLIQSGMIGSAPSSALALDRGGRRGRGEETDAKGDGSTKRAMRCGLELHSASASATSSTRTSSGAAVSGASPILLR
jgi:hypothetical protein